VVIFRVDREGGRGCRSCSNRSEPVHELG
jgi:hypothetical protein